MVENIRLTGLQVNYYFVCKRKLWLFSKNIEMEKSSDLVAMGKLIDEHTYSREKKNISINNTINIDFIDNKGIINEVKKSKSIEKADIHQVKYYIYYLLKRGVKNVNGIINYPKLREKVKVELTENDIKEFDRIVIEIGKILKRQTPPPVLKSKICKKCSYYELCFI